MINFIITSILFLLHGALTTIAAAWLFYFGICWVTPDKTNYKKVVFAVIYFITAFPLALYVGNLFADFIFGQFCALYTVPVWFVVSKLILFFRKKKEVEETKEDVKIIDVK